MEFRTLRETELEQWFDHCIHVFNEGVYDEAFRQRFVKHWYNDPAKNLEYIFVAIDNGEIASTVRVFIREMLINGQPVPMGGIGEVSTKPEYRGQGLAPKLMDMAIDKMEANQFHASLLATGVQGFYEKKGWQGLQLQYLQGTIEGKHSFPANIREVCLDTDLPEIQKLYETYNQDSSGTITRGQTEYWKNWIMEDAPLGLVATDDNGSILAYLLAEEHQDYVTILDYAEKNVGFFDSFVANAFKNKEIRFLRRIQTKSSHFTVYQKDDWMIRLMNPMNVKGRLVNTTQELVELINSSDHGFTFWDIDGF